MNRYNNKNYSLQLYDHYITILSSSNIYIYIYIYIALDENDNIYPEKGQPVRT